MATFEACDCIRDCGGVHTVSTAPHCDARQGDTWFNTVNSKFYVYWCSAWVQLA
jgi:hypothetical protein